jgi:tRNA C32,U32 (ribose-2'-O)-methylase TrmJ
MEEMGLQVLYLVQPEYMQEVEEVRSGRAHRCLGDLRVVRAVLEGVDLEHMLKMV